MSGGTIMPVYCIYLGQSYVSPALAESLCLSLATQASCNLVGDSGLKC